MGRLVKEIDGVTHIAYERVAGPGYVMYVADGVSGNGWTYVENDFEPSDFPQNWVASDTGYTTGEVRKLNGAVWVNQVEGNVRPPGESGWVDVVSFYPDWVQPLGAHNAYPINQIVKHDGSFWIATVDANVWEPPTYWRQTLVDLSAAPPEWIQPTGAGNDYQTGDKVTYQGQVWRSIAANNVWAPGVYGWVID